MKACVAGWENCASGLTNTFRSLPDASGKKRLAYKGSFEIKHTQAVAFYHTFFPFLLKQLFQNVQHSEPSSQDG